MIVVNAESRHDIEVQLEEFFKDLGCKRPGYGLSQYGNIKTWIYDGPGRSPHNVQENYRIYYFLRSLLDCIKDDDFALKYQKEILYINDWWRAQSLAQEEITALKEENKKLKNTQDRLYNDILNNTKRAKSIFNEKRTARIDLINTSDGAADLKWEMISDPGASLQTPEWFNQNGHGYILQSDKGKITFKAKCIGSGTIQLALRGINKKDKYGSRLPVWVDFESVQINGNFLLNETKPVWHDKPFRINYTVKDGDYIFCIITWKEHAGT